MAVTLAELQALGARPVTLATTDGSFAGSIVPQNLSERSVMLEFRLDGDPERQIVIPVDEITEIVER